MYTMKNYYNKLKFQNIQKKYFLNATNDTNIMKVNSSRSISLSWHSKNRFSSVIFNWKLKSELRYSNTSY